MARQQTELSVTWHAPEHDGELVAVASLPPVPSKREGVSGDKGLATTNSCFLLAATHTTYQCAPPCLLAPALAPLHLPCRWHPADRL